MYHHANNCYIRPVKYSLLLIMILVFSLFAAAQDEEKMRMGAIENDTVAKKDKTTKTQFFPLPDTVRTDSVSAGKKLTKRHSPTKAALLSLAFPGLGQAYNKRWWKLPIVYAGFAGLGYGLYHFGSDYSGYRRAYRNNLSDTTTIYSYKGTSDVATLRVLRDNNKRNLDIMAVLTAVWYVLQIVDATVDAHLFHWNVDDKLAMDVQPMLPQIPGRGVAGISLQFSFVQPQKRKAFQF